MSTAWGIRIVAEGITPLSWSFEVVCSYLMYCTKSKEVGSANLALVSWQCASGVPFGLEQNLLLSSVWAYYFEAIAMEAVTSKVSKPIGISLEDAMLVYN